MKITNTLTRKRELLNEIFWSLLANTTLRLHYCRARYYFLKHNLKFHPNLENSKDFNKEVADYNAAFHDAAFGCGGRMAILLHPLMALFYPSYDKKLLIVGPRTEDDIIWAKSIGFKNVRGLDLFSYSPYIDVGDAHKTAYADNTFDAVILAWVLPYTNSPTTMINEMKRIIKNEGFLGIGWHWSSSEVVIGNNRARGNTINSYLEVKNLLGGDLQIAINPEMSSDHHKAIFTRIHK